MKVNDKFIALHVKDLYIPHGSDERRPVNGLMTWKLSLLYIPHGSDESLSTVNRLKKSSHFISHMVQMKDFKKNS